jgi:E3 ubiquitin-protein ligase SHPRH
VGAAGLKSALLGSGSSSSSSGGGGSGGPLTMDAILGVLTTKAKTEAEEAQRQLIGALNGLAALMRLFGDGAGAVAAYREGLAAAEAHKQEVRGLPGGGGLPGGAVAGCSSVCLQGRCWL